MKSSRFILLRMVALAAVLLAATAGHTNAVHTVQVTIGAGTTQVSTNDVYCRHLTFQNNQTHTMRIGDVNTSSTQGSLLGVGPPGGSYTIAITGNGKLNLADWYVAGTQNDVLDVIYVD